MRIPCKSNIRIIPTFHDSFSTIVAYHSSHSPPLILPPFHSFFLRLVLFFTCNNYVHFDFRSTCAQSSLKLVLLLSILSWVNFNFFEDRSVNFPAILVVSLKNSFFMPWYFFDDNWLASDLPFEILSFAAFPYFWLQTT